MAVTEAPTNGGGSYYPEFHTQRPEVAGGSNHTTENVLPQQALAELGGQAISGNGLASNTGPVEQSGAESNRTTLTKTIEQNPSRYPGMRPPKPNQRLLEMIARQSAERRGQGLNDEGTDLTLASRGTPRIFRDRIRPESEE